VLARSSDRAARTRRAVPGLDKTTLDEGAVMSVGISWVILVFAGVLEVGWAVGLKHTDGFTRLVPSVLTVAMLAGSIGALAVAAGSLPLGTAYSVWVGIGALGASTAGILLFGEPASAPRLAFMALLVVAVVGLKVTSGGH
jgi:quaternary ammonium compound-resistance protein SugE